MGIEQICNSIKNLFSAARVPAKQISRILLVCAMIKRPGLSAIRSTANIVKDLSKLGIPTGQMPDGSPNLTVGFVYSNVKENHRALRFDASVQVGTQVGSQMVQVGNLTGFNITPGFGLGSIS